MLGGKSALARHWLRGSTLEGTCRSLEALDPDLVDGSMYRGYLITPITPYGHDRLPTGQKCEVAISLKERGPVIQINPRCDLVCAECQITRVHKD